MRASVCVRGFTLQGGEPLVGEVVVSLQSFDASLESLLLLLHLLDPQLQLLLLRRSPLGQLLLPALRHLEEEKRGKKRGDDKSAKAIKAEERSTKRGGQGTSK